MDSGARFYRCDFQLHTPRDARWGGAPAISDAERELWARSLIAACRKMKLDAIAITDHHDLAMYRYVRDAANTETRADGSLMPVEQCVVAFPGMELTLTLPCQAIVLFDADIPLDYLAQLPGALGYTPAHDAAEKGAVIEKLSQIQHPNDVYERLGSLPYLKDRFIVLPHVQENGHKTLIRAGFDDHYRRFSGAGGYVDGTVPRTGTGARNILDGADANYGRKPLAVFQTSDNRSGDFSNLGKHSTWVKWSKPTAEALRQSCLARQSRICQTQPDLPAISITRVEVTQSKFLGRMNVFLNPQYNAFIGGRGTGKSTLLEYVRWALCVSPAAGGEDTPPEYEQRSRSLIEKTLAEVKGAVRVWISVRGVEHVIDRRTGADVDVQVKVGAEEFRVASEDEVRRLVPIEAYSQKELSSLGRRTEEVLRFVLSPVARDVAAREDELRHVADRVRGAFAQLRRYRKSASEHEVLQRERQSLEKQRDAVRTGITDLDPTDAATLALADAYKVAGSLRDQWKQELLAARVATQTALAAVKGTPSPLPAAVADLPDGKLLAGMLEEVGGLLTGMREGLGKVEASFESGPAAARLATLDTQFDAALGVARDKFRIARERSQVHEGAIRQIEVITQQMDAISKRLAALQPDLEGREKADGAFLEVSAAWSKVLAERAALTSQRCDSISETSGNIIRCRLRESSRLSSIFGVVAEVARGTRIKGDRFDALRERIEGQAVPLKAWLAVLDELLLIAGISEEGQLPDVPQLRAAGFNDRELRLLGAKLDDDTWMRLRLMAPDDDVQFDYRTREGDYIAFQDASAGQRATALMRILLAEEGPPLLIDQPEDDLDNQVIHQISEELWRAKSRRQLIFASHNANLVVNGDADLIAVFDYKVAGEQTSGELTAEGSIDDTNVRNAIATIMEGGRSAFALRRAKYGF